MLVMLGVGSLPNERAGDVDFELFHEIISKCLPYVNSIGLNEQELHILHHHIINHSNELITSSKPSVMEISLKIQDILRFRDAATTTKQTDFETRTPLSSLDRLHFVRTIMDNIACAQCPQGNNDVHHRAFDVVAHFTISHSVSTQKE